MISRVIHGIAYDPYRDEFVVPNFFAQAILTFRGGADGDEPPIRIIQGPSTKLGNLSRLAVDPIHNEIFIPLEQRGLLVFPQLGEGDVPPLRILNTGENGMLEAKTVAVDPVNDVIVVGGQYKGEKGGRLMVFERTAKGNDKPLRVIGGPRGPVGGAHAVYPPRKWVITTSGGSGGGDSELASDTSFVGIYSIEDNGDVPPRWTIGGPYGVMQEPRSVTLDVKNKTLIVSDKRLNAVLSFYFPEMF